MSDPTPEPDHPDARDDETAPPPAHQDDTLTEAEAKAEEEAARLGDFA